jgi:hypothetical protein
MRSFEKYLFEDYFESLNINNDFQKSLLQGSNTRDAVEISSLRDGPISCHYPDLPKGFDM